MSRLRKLDRLFAERVLGIQPHEEIACPEEIPGCLVYHYKGRSLIWECPPYTRSIDAAWEGVSVGMNVVKLNSGYAAFDSQRSDGIRFLSKAPHPAEALVLACLRAVGVTEEELAFIDTQDGADQ